jgi:EAL domain-containing protein (putative c-di-GMP-specific phosphodiesterase class I)
MEIRRVAQLQRPQDGRPGRDWVRVKPAEKAAAIPEKPQHDDQKLLALLHSAKQELQGLRLVHLHLSLLKEKNYGDVNSIRRAFQEISENSVFLQIFSLSNDDIIILYKGIKFSSISDVCQGLERILLSRTQASWPNPYREDSIYSILELSLNFVNVIRFIEGLDQNAGLDGAKARTKPPITLEELAKIERQMPIFDLSPFMLNQPVVNIHADDRNEREYFELYIAIKTLEERLSPNFDIAANKWLFNYFTSNLDNSVLKTLNYGVGFLRGQRIGLNLNLTTILSATFLKFDERLTADLRRNVVLEVNKADLVENETLYREVVDFARQRGYRICIDGLTPFWVVHMDLEYMAADYAKVFWSPDFADMDPDELHAFEQKVRQQQNCRFVLARCGTVSGLLFAHRHGIDLVQGRMVDNILRKGVRIADAIRTAREMDDA